VLGKRLRGWQGTHSSFKMPLEKRYYALRLYILYARGELQTDKLNFYGFNNISTCTTTILVLSEAYMQNSRFNLGTV